MCVNLPTQYHLSFLFVFLYRPFQYQRQIQVPHGTALKYAAFDGTFISPLKRDSTLLYSRILVLHTSSDTGWAPMSPRILELGAATSSICQSSEPPYVSELGAGSCASLRALSHHMSLNLGGNYNDSALMLDRLLSHHVSPGLGWAPVPLHVIRLGCRLLFSALPWGRLAHHHPL
jgi:hypothetical protein